MKRNLIMLFATFSFVIPSLNAAAADKSTQQATSSKRVTHTIQPGKTTVARNVVSDYDGSGVLQLGSSKALIINQETGETLYAKNTNTPTPIASVTKLMTAMVVLDAGLPMDEIISVSKEDIDTLKGTTSRLRVGISLPRGEMLRLALMSSENRAASALARHYPGGLKAFLRDMNYKAYELGMLNTRFVDPTGLNSGNVSTAEDLVKMVRAAYEYEQIRLESTATSQEVAINGNRNPMQFINTNSLVRKGDWVIGLSKTGYISEAGRCLVMQAEIGGQPLIIVLLDSDGKLTRIGDANRIRKWIENSYMTARMG
ncbi:MAG: D-alanyl-D-alanine endopeptidase [Betaproteobacteria bacterium HGW-Betaproteobacteria-2]|nr:MAG: D-alanyl-D-alanine endopeptidase [Betaproteobacteria bacterium HGW-Betaproteobacteria-2]